MPASALIRALRSDRNMRYIDGVLIKHQRKGWSKMTKEEQGKYSMLQEVFNADKELSIYEDQLFYALGKYPEIDKAFKGSSLLDEALVTKAFSKKIDTTLDDYIKRIEDMIKKAESGEYTYTTNDISALLEELAEEGLTELIKDRKSLNMLANPLDISIDEAGKLDVLVDAVKEIIQKFAYVDDATTPTRMNPILFNLRLSKQHINNLDDVQINKPKRDWRDDDVFNGEDAQGVYADPSINDYSLNSDMSFNAAYYNVAKEAKYKPIESAEYKFVYQDDVWPLPPETKKTQPKTGDIAQDVNNRRAVLEQEKSDLEGQVATAESYMRNRDEPQLNREGKAMLKEAQKALEEIEAEIARLMGVTKKQGGGFIDSPLYLRDY